MRLSLLISAFEKKDIQSRYLLTHIVQSLTKRRIQFEIPRIKIKLKKKANPQFFFVKLTYFRKFQHHPLKRRKNSTKMDVLNADINLYMAVRL